MDYHIKTVLILLIIFIVCIIIFSFIYNSINKNSDDPLEKGYVNSLYTSITIQTNIGMKSEPKNNSIRAWVMVQSIISYFITVGFLLIILKYIFRNGNQK